MDRRRLCWFEFVFVFVFVFVFCLLFLLNVNVGVYMCSIMWIMGAHWGECARVFSRHMARIRQCASIRIVLHRVICSINWMHLHTGRDILYTDIHTLYIRIHVCTFHTYRLQSIFIYCIYLYIYLNLNLICNMNIGIYRIWICPETDVQDARMYHAKCIWQVEVHIQVCKRLHPAPVAVGILIVHISSVFQHSLVLTFEVPPTPSLPGCGTGRFLASPSPFSPLWGFRRWRVSLLLVLGDSWPPRSFYSEKSRICTHQYQGCTKHKT